MMKKLILSILFLAVICGAPGYAAGFSAEDFANQSVIVAQSSSGAQQCQAVRISPKWYLTAAHCVRPVCDKECTVTVNLLQGSLQAGAWVRHTAADPAVFVPRQYRPGNAKNIRYDIALLRFDPAGDDYFYYDALAQKTLDYQTFSDRLKSSAYADEYSQWTALQKARPRLLGVTDAFSRHVAKPLAVPDLRAGGIYFQQSQTDDFYYFTELRHYMGSNFGVEKGMSGSGVVAPGGDVIGIVSSSLNTVNALVTYNEKDEPVGTVPYSADYFLFTPLNRQNINFIRATAASFRDQGRGPRTANVTADIAPQTDLTVQEAFLAAPTVEDITFSKEKK